MPFDENSLRVLRCVLDRLVPRDEFPSASDASGLEYLDRHCRAFPRDLVLLQAGVAHLQALARSQHDAPFESLSEPEQDALLQRLEEASKREREAAPGFLERLLNLAMEGYYADPENGGNREGVSWKMVGYDPRRPRGEKP